MAGLIERLGRLLERILLVITGPADRGWRTSWRVALFAVVLALLHGSQPPESLRSEDLLDAQEQHPFDANGARPESHGGKVAFRLTMPILGRILHLDRIGYFVVLVLAGIVVFAVLHRIITDRTSSPRYATLCCLALAFCYLGQAYVADLNIFFDGIAIAFAGGALVVGSAPVAALLAFLALFTDERALITIVVGALAVRAVTGTLRPLGLAAGILAYASARLGLQWATDLRSHTEGIGLAITSDLGVWGPVGVVGAWSSVWLLIVPGLADLRRRRGGLLLIVAFVGASASAVLVYDVTKSAAYCLPAVVAAIVVLRQTRPQVADRLALTAAIVGGLVPAMTVVEQFYWHFPLPYHVLRLVLT